MRHIPATAVQPRAEGALSLRIKSRGELSAIDRFRASGAFKALFPRRAPGVEAIILNTAGGVTGGDRFQLSAEVGQGAHLTLTTQAAERAYRSSDGWGRTESKVSVETDATLHWLPQELILFDGCSLRRRLRIDLSETARALVVEPVIFGRTAMGETLKTARFHDQIALFRQGRPIYRDAVRMDGDIATQLSRGAVTAGAGAMASLVYVAPDAGAQLAPVRAMLPETGGASLLGDDILVMRVVAAGSHELRRTMLPVLDRLSRDALPTSWRL